jgi:hypothetical protein
MFDLNNGIQEWRKELSGTGCCYSKDIEELESHLREETESLTATGLSQEEGFLVARHRLGKAEALGREFSKINTWAVWRFRIFWMAVGVLGLNLLGLVFNLADFIGVAAVRALNMPNEYLGYSVIVSKIVLFGLEVFVFWFIVRRINSNRQTSAGKQNKRAFLRSCAATILLVLAGGGFAIKGLCYVGMFRLVSQQEMGSFFMLNAWFNSLGSILLNILLAGLVIYFYPRRLGPSLKKK